MTARVNSPGNKSPGLLRPSFGVQINFILGLGLAILVVLFRNRATINVDELDALKG